MSPSQKVGVQRGLAQTASPGGSSPDPFRGKDQMQYYLSRHWAARQAAFKASLTWDNHLEASSLLSQRSMWAEGSLQASTSLMKLSWRERPLRGGEGGEREGELFWSRESCSSQSGASPVDQACLAGESELQLIGEAGLNLHRCPSFWIRKARYKHPLNTNAYQPQLQKPLFLAESKNLTESI